MEFGVFELIKRAVVSLEKVAAELERLNDNLEKLFNLNFKFRE